MMRLLLLGVLLAVSLTPISSPVQGKGLGVSGYHSSLSGHVAGFRLAGIEPDGDPLYQTVLQTKLSASGGLPAVNLIVNSYLENFKPDTTPILPDLLHPQSTAQNLGGFLNGKALLTDNAGNVLYVGSFLAEAFLDNSNHAVVALPPSTLAGQGGRLKGMFRLRKDGSVSGSFGGTLRLSPAARRQLEANRGASMKPIKQIIGIVTVKPHPMMGKSTTGSSGAPLHTGFGGAAPQKSAGRPISPLTIVAGIGAIVSLLIAGLLYWSEKHRPRQAV